jgi:general secretion pathway protein D
MTKVSLKTLLVCVLCVGSSYPIAGQGEKGTEKKAPEQQGSSSPKDPKEKDVEFEEVRSPFGMQRVPKRTSGASPIQPVAPAPGSPLPSAVPAAQAPPQNTPAPTPPAPQAEVAAPGLPTKASEAPGAAAATRSDAGVAFVCVNCDLLEFIRNVGTELKLNYVVDPRVKGIVTVHTYGELKKEDLLPVLESVLRVNNAALVKTGNFYQIVPIAGARQMPLPLRKPGEEPSAVEEGKVIQIVPMRFMSAADMVKVLEPYVSEGGHIAFHAQANILLITETTSNLKKLMELVNLFDSDVFQNKRVQLYPIRHSRPHELIPDLEKVFSAYSSGRDSAVRFIGIERLNALLAISANPSSLLEVEKWLAKLDQPLEAQGIRNFVYRVENSDAKKLEPVLLRIYGRQFGGGAATIQPSVTSIPPSTTPSASTSGGGQASRDSADPASGIIQGDVKIVADEMNNALIVRCTPQDYEVVKETIKLLDVVPRQVLIDVKIFEVTLTGNLSMGVSAFLQRRAEASKITTASFSASAVASGPAGLNIATFANIGMTRELVAFLNAQETRSRSRVLSAPSVIASDNIEAHIQVGQEVPILTAQGVVPGGTGGGSLFTNSVQNRSTGIILSVTPRINPSGWVTLKVNQEVSSPGPPPLGSSIESPSINIRSVGTQITVKDGETIAIGGIISETKGVTKNRVPFLGDIPGVGLLFGNSSYNTDRTELIALITPKLIEDIDQAHDVTEELKSQLKSLRKDLRRLEQQSQ